MYTHTCMQYQLIKKNRGPDSEKERGKVSVQAWRKEGKGAMLQLLYKPSNKKN